MINLNQLKSLPKIKPELEQQEKLQEYLHSIEQSLIVAWRSGKKMQKLNVKTMFMKVMHSSVI